MTKIKGLLGSWLKSVYDIRQSHFETWLLIGWQQSWQPSEVSFENIVN